jgi:hypothetical protein
MGDGLQSYSGVTSEQGRCEPIGGEVDLYGLPVGYYKVHIVHEGQGIDATRGCEVADDAPTGNRIEIALYPGPNARCRIEAGCAGRHAPIAIRFAPLLSD